MYQFNGAEMGTKLAFQSLLHFLKKEGIYSEKFKKNVAFDNSRVYAAIKGTCR